MKKTISLGLLVAALAASPVQAQQPLRTLCLSHQMEYCMSVLSWNWSYLAPPSDTGYGSVQLNSMTEFFGSGLIAGDPWREFAYQAQSAGDNFYMQVRSASPGLFDITQQGGSNLMAYVPSVYEDIQWMHFLDGSTRRWCDARIAYGDGGCYEVDVPEPGTMLLVVTGLFGFAFVRRRRLELEA